MVVHPFGLKSPKIAKNVAPPPQISGADPLLSKKNRCQFWTLYWGGSGPFIWGGGNPSGPFIWWGFLVYPVFWGFLAWPTVPSGAVLGLWHKICGLPPMAGIFGNFGFSFYLKFGQLLWVPMRESDPRRAAFLH